MIDSIMQSIVIVYLVLGFYIGIGSNIDINGQYRYVWFTKFLVMFIWLPMILIMSYAGLFRAKQ